MLKLFNDLEEMSAALGRKKESAKWKRHAKSLGGPALARIPSPDGLIRGDFKNLGYSVYKYRPFTLEGNFAAVQAVNEMLLQTINGIIHVGYSLPVGICASFEQLRTEGGFLVSAEISEGGTLQSSALGRTREPFHGFDRIGNLPFARRPDLEESGRSPWISDADCSRGTHAGTFS